MTGDSAGATCRTAGWDPLRRSISALSGRLLRRNRPDLRSLLGALDSVPHGLCIYDGRHRLVFVNEGFCRIYNQPRETLPLGTAFLDVLRGSIKVGNYPGRSAEDVWSERRAFIDRAESGVFLQMLGDGRLIAITHQPLADGGWAAVYEDVTERRRTETQLKFLAHHDPLTGLPNRLQFGEKMDEAIASLASGQTCALLCLDLDGFKPVNDRLGHAAGDEILREVALRIGRGVAEQQAVAARLGGDEFAVLMPHGDRAAARHLASRLERTMIRPYDLGPKGRITIGVSIGVACAPQDATTSQDLLAAADSALYGAKRRQGRAA